MAKLSKVMVAVSFWKVIPRLETADTTEYPSIGGKLRTTVVVGERNLSRGTYLSQLNTSCSTIHN
jgi:hypothetical protein